jgi:tetrahydromethanopterin S-methyltransferase subunit C
VFNVKIIFASVIGLLFSTAAHAVVAEPIPVSEPGTIGLVAGAVVAVVAFARVRRGK